MTFVLTDLAANTLTFNGLGGVEDPTTDPIITLFHGTRRVELDISPTTGTVTETASGG